MGLAGRLRFVAQDKLLNLTRRGLRQLLEHHPLRAFEVGKVVSTKRDEFRFGRGLAGLQGHECARYLAPFFIRLGHNGDFHDRGVPVQDAFHFDGGDVLSARDNDVLGAVLDFDVSIGVANR